jgi:glycosyltransferase involved in cell wall biosynthesis
MAAVLVLPTDPNPYQELLYGAMPPATQVHMSRHSRWLFLTHPLFLIGMRIRGVRLIHLHWLYFLSPPIAPGLIHRLYSEWNIRLFLALVRILRYRLVWTMHNVQPHEAQTGDDLRTARIVAAAADRIIVHSAAARPLLATQGIPTERVVVVPHGNYVGRYGAPADPDTTRSSFGLDQDVPTVLFFGMIRPYKGVGELVAVFDVDDPPAAQLLIAGECPDAALRALIEQAAARRTHILFRHGHVDDSQVAAYLAAADVVCLPFRRVTTSGSALLALSYGRPLIAPRMGDLAELAELPEPVGIFYDPSDPDGLRSAVERAVTDRGALIALGERGRRFAGTLGWPEIAQSTAEVYAGALAPRGPRP